MTYEFPEFVDVGDTGLLVRFSDEMDWESNLKVHDLARRLQSRPQAAARFTEATSEGTSRMSDMVPSPLMVAPEMPDTEPM